MTVTYILTCFMIFDLLYDMYDADLVDVALETLSENELLDGVPAMLEAYYNNY